MPAPTYYLKSHIIPGSADTVTGNPAGAVGDATQGVPLLRDVYSDSVQTLNGLIHVTARQYGALFNVVDSENPTALANTNQQVEVAFPVGTIPNIQIRLRYRTVSGTVRNFAVYSNISGNVALYGTTTGNASSHALQFLGALNALPTNKQYKLRVLVFNDTSAGNVATLQLRVFNVTDNVPATWLSGSPPAPDDADAGIVASYNLTTQVATVQIAGANADYGMVQFAGEGACDLLGIDYYNDQAAVSSPPLTGASLVASSITTTTAHLTTSVAGGTGTKHYFYERKTNDTDGDFVDALLPDAAELDLSGLASSIYHNYRVTITDSATPTPQTVTTGVRFQTATPPAQLAAYCFYEFFAPNIVHLTMMVSGGDGNYTYLWSKPSGETNLTLDNTTLTSQTLVLTCSDVEVHHNVRVHIADGAGHVWYLNDTNYPTFSFPVRPYLRHTDTVLYPTSGTPVALPSGFKWAQQGDSLSEDAPNGHSTSYYVGQRLAAAKGLSSVNADFYNSAYGSSSATAASNKAATATYLVQNNVTDFAIRVAYNDQLTPQQSHDNIVELATYVAQNAAAAVKRIWILPNTFRNAGQLDWGDTNEARLRTLQTLLSPLHNTIINGTKLLYGSTLVYDSTQADCAYYNGGDRYTHFGDVGAQAIGAYDANAVLSQFPVASNTPTTGLVASATQRFVFPVAGTIAGQVVTWSVAKVGGGAAWGTIDQTGLYTAPSTLPTSAGAADTITATSAGGSVATVAVQYVSGTPSNVATPTFSPAAGTYTSAQTVTLACATSGAVIHFTIDGTTPTASSPTYSTGLAVPTTRTIKALAVKAGMADSAVASALFTINIPTPPSGRTLTPNDLADIADLIAAANVGTVTRLVQGPLTLTPDTKGSDGSITLFVGDNGSLRLRLGDGQGNSVPVGGVPLFGTVVNPVTGTVSDGIACEVISDPEGIVDYLIQPDDTAIISNFNRLTLSRTLNGETHTFGPVILNVRAK